MRRVRFADLSVPNPAHKAELLQAVDRILTHGQLMLGPEVEVFERRIAEYCDTRYCVGMSSGTDAVYLALRSVGIGPGDEVITTPLSWIATLNAIHMCGGVPVFVDIGEDLNLNADLIEEAITQRTKAIVPVHFTGRLCDMEKICSIARKHHLLVVEDAAQAFGANINGTKAGAFADAGAFSFNPMKVLPAYGEAGAVVTGSRETYEKLLSLRYLGTVEREVCYYPSLNSKIDALQAAMLMVSLNYFESNTNRRLEIAQCYSDALAGVVKCPPIPPGGVGRSVFFDYTIITESRDELRAYLGEHGIETKIKHLTLMPNQPAYTHLPRTALPVADNMVTRILSLPIYDKLSASDVEYVTDRVRAFHTNVAHRSAEGTVEGTVPDVRV